MIEQGYYVDVVGFGESADARQTYKNRRAELYGMLRELLRPDAEGPGFAIPPQSYDLRQELAVLPLAYDSEGRLQLPPKERKSSHATGEKSIRQLLGRSPDRADSLVLGVRALKRPDYSDDGSDWFTACGDVDDVPPVTEADIAKFPSPYREALQGYGCDSNYWDTDWDEADDDGDEFSTWP